LRVIIITDKINSQKRKKRLSKCILNCLQWGSADFSRPHKHKTQSETNM